MSLTIITTPLDAANSYASIADVDAILAVLPDVQTAAWFKLKDIAKSKLVATATRLIDENFTFIGRRYSPEQTLQWPRSEVAIDGLWSNPNDYCPDYLSNTTVPNFIKTACADLARHLATTDILEDKSTDAISKVEVGSIKVEFNSAPKNTQMPASVLSTLRKWSQYQGSVGKEEERVQSISLTR